MSRNICEVHHLGIIDYQSAWDLQNHFAAEIAAGERQPTLLLLEHPHTYTFGRRGEATNLLWDEAERTRLGVVVHWVHRGGDVTYHGPGQLVGYPLLPLGSLALQQVDYVGYIRKLEQVVIAAVAEFNVQAFRLDGLTGVWTVCDPSMDNVLRSMAKLAAIGVKVDALGISRHGFALNVNPDMEYWEGIIGCGLEHPEISLAQLRSPVPTMDDVVIAILQAFSQVFGYELKKKPQA